MIQFYAKSKGRDTLIIRPFLPSANFRHIPIGWRKLLPFGHLSNKTADKKAFVLNWPFPFLLPKKRFKSFSHCQPELMLSEILHLTETHCCAKHDLFWNNNNNNNDDNSNNNKNNNKKTHCAKHDLFWDNNYVERFPIMKL